MAALAQRTSRWRTRFEFHDERYMIPPKKALAWHKQFLF
jgi:hypothetical protein